MIDGATLFGLCGAVLTAIGLYGAIAQAAVLRKILALNVLGGGVLLVFGAVARRGAAEGLGADPVPHAMVITAIVVAFVSTALAVALLLRLHEATGRATLTEEETEAAPRDIAR